MAASPAQDRATLPVPKELDAVLPGERVWVVHVADSRRRSDLFGTLLTSDSAGLRIATAGGDTVALPRAALRALAVSRGGRDRASSARTGALVGAVLGGAFGYGVGDDCDQSPDLICFDRGETGPLGLLLGATVGALTGALTGGERWVSVPLPKRSASSAPAPATGDRR